MTRFAAIRSGWVVGVLMGTPPSINLPLGLTFQDVTHLPEVTVGWRYNIAGFFEQADMTQKEQFITALRDQMTVLGQTIEKTKSLITAFQDRNYDALASDPITDADLATFGVLQYDLGLAFNLCQQIQTLAADPFNERAIAKWRTL